MSKENSFAKSDLRVLCIGLRFGRNVWLAMAGQGVRSSQFNRPPDWPAPAAMRVQRPGQASSMGHPLVGYGWPWGSVQSARWVDRLASHGGQRLAVSVQCATPLAGDGWPAGWPSQFNGSAEWPAMAAMADRRFGRARSMCQTTGWLWPARGIGPTCLMGQQTG